MISELLDHFKDVRLPVSQPGSRMAESPVLIQKAMGPAHLQSAVRYRHPVAQDLLALVETVEERDLRAASDR